MLIEAGVLALLSAAVAFFATPMVARFAIRLGMYDRPSERKMHPISTPYLGGIAILGGWLISFLGIGNFRLIGPLVLGIAILATLGYLDDKHNLKPGPKVPVLVAVALMAWGFGLRLTPFDVYPLDLGLTLFWFVGITSAFNFMDNMDGLASGVGSVGAIALGAMAAIAGRERAAMLAFTLAAALVGFLAHNRHPARVFMGDLGSLPLGFGLASIATLVPSAHQPGFEIVAPMIALGLFVVDSTVMLGGRMLRGEPLVGGRTDHISHRLAASGIRVPDVFLWMSLAAAAYGLAGMAVFQLQASWAAALTGIVASLSLASLYPLLRLQPMAQPLPSDYSVPQPQRVRVLADSVSSAPELAREAE